MVVITAVIYKMHARIANREDPDLKKQSDLGLSCLSWSFCQATYFQNFRTFIVPEML